MATLSITVSAQRLHREFHVDQTPQSVAIGTDSPVVIDVANLALNGVVGIDRANSTASGEVLVRAWIVSYDPEAEPLVAPGAIESVTKLDMGRLQADSNLIRIDAGSGSSERAVVHLSVPEGLKLRLSVNGSLIDIPADAKGVLVQNGNTVTSRSGLEPMAAVFHTVRPSVAFRSLGTQN
jgi:hypothetical protein